MKRAKGFTLIELLGTFVILGIMLLIAVPAFSTWLPNYRLRSAARDVYSNMQLAKLGAVKENTTWRIVFDTGAGSYSIWSPGPNGNWDGYAGDDEQVRTVDLSSYQSGIGYGHGNATKDATTAGGALPGDNVSYDPPANVEVFNSRGTCTAGYVYLENDKGITTYAIGTRSNGIIRLVKWNSSIADWE
jgi:Tfp pilus assembly protein FimT